MEKPKITGEFRKRFNKWYHNQTSDKNLTEHAVFSFFEKMHFLLQFGMLESFLNKNGIFPHIIDTLLEDPDNNNYDSNKRYHSVIRTHEKWYAIGFHKDKIDSQKEVIEVSIEMFNEKYAAAV